MLVTQPELLTVMLQQMHSLYSVQLRLRWWCKPIWELVIHEKSYLKRNLVFSHFALLGRKICRKLRVSVIFYFTAVNYDP